MFVSTTINSSSTDGEDDSTRYQTTKKKKKTGRMSEVNMKLKLQSFETGKDCFCRLKCFEKVGNQKVELIKRMNSFGSNDLVNVFFAGLITVLPVQGRRPRVDDNEAIFRDANYSYNLRFVDESGPSEIPVCKKAFMALHGVEQDKEAYIFNSLKKLAMLPKIRGGSTINTNTLKIQKTKYVTT